jgi:hypothetical protein
MSPYLDRLLSVRNPRFFHDMIPLEEETFSTVSVPDVGAEYTVTEKTIVIKSMTDTLTADINNFDMPIILNYIISLLWKKYILDFVSHVIDLVGNRTSFVLGLTHLLTSLVINRHRFFPSI